MWSQFSWLHISRVVSHIYTESAVSRLSQTRVTSPDCLVSVHFLSDDVWLETVADLQQVNGLFIVIDQKSCSHRAYQYFVGFQMEFAAFICNNTDNTHSVPFFLLSAFLFFEATISWSSIRPSSCWTELHPSVHYFCSHRHCLLHEQI